MKKRMTKEIKENERTDEKKNPIKNSKKKKNVRRVYKKYIKGNT